MPKDTNIGTHIPASVVQAHLERGEDFVSRYANHVQVESGPFDLKVVFGLVDQAGVAKIPPRAIVEQHTAMNLAWPEVKVLIYFMQVHLAGYEKTNGKVKIPTDALPPEIPSNLPPQYDTQEGRESIELLRRMREEFIANLKD